MALYNISFNLTFINYATKKTTGSSLVDSILSKNESDIKSDIKSSTSENETIKDKTDSTTANNRIDVKNNNTPNFFEKLYIKFHKIIFTNRFVLFFHNKYFYYILKILKFSL
jgi:hypothetical protein